MAFLVDVVGGQPEGEPIHVIADNLSAHKTEAVAEFLATHPDLQLTTPGLLFLAQSGRNLILQNPGLTRGIFTPKAELAGKVARHTKAHNKGARRFKWTYRNSGRRIQ